MEMSERTLNDAIASLRGMIAEHAHSMPATQYDDVVSSLELLIVRARASGNVRTWWDPDGQVTPYITGDEIASWSYDPDAHRLIVSVRSAGSPSPMVNFHTFYTADAAMRGVIEQEARAMLDRLGLQHVVLPAFPAAEVSSE